MNELQETMGKLQTTQDFSAFKVDPENRFTDSPNSIQIETMISNGNLEKVPTYIKDLAMQIKATGCQNDTPITVLPKSADGYYTSAWGNSRLLSIKYLEAIGESPTLRYEIRSDLVDSAKRMASRFLENHARSDVSPTQKAYEISQLKSSLESSIKLDNPEMKLRDIASNVTQKLIELTGLAVSTLSVYSNYGSFPELLKNYVDGGKIDIYAAYTVYTATKENPDSVVEDLAALIAIAIANGRSSISQGMVKTYYQDSAKSKEDTQKLRKAIERSAPALQVAVDDGEIDSDTLALAQIESEATGIPAEQIIENTQSDPEATKEDVAASAKKLQNRSEAPKLSRKEADSKIALNLESLQQIKLSAYDQEGKTAIQNRVAGLLKSVSTLVEVDENLISGMIGLLATLNPINDDAASTLANIYDRGFDGINSVKSEQEKIDDEAAKAERVADKAKAKEDKEPKNSTKSTETKAKKSKKKAAVEETK